VSAPARRFLRATAPIGGLILLSGVLLAWLLSRQLVRPLHQLTLATEGIGHEQSRAAIPTSGNDEVGRLGTAFMRMAVRVEEEARAREASESQWRAVFDGSPHPKWVADATTRRFLAVNPAAIREYGYAEAEFLQLDESALEVPTSSAGAGEAGTLTRHRTKSGAILDVELTTHALSFMGVPARFVLAQNVTARNQLESRFRQAQKMQAIGRLAGGVAHDFNNFLTAIGAYAELALDGLPPDSERARDIQEILRAATQANRLTRQLLAFTRQQVVQPLVLELDAAVVTMGEMLKHLVRENVQVVSRLDSAHARVTIDPGHLEQVLMNLVVNARDAMPRGGRITIRTAVESLDAPSARLHGLETPGRYAILSVADTGVGMTTEVRARIFEPFFTTKGVGQGTGLGLATVYGIVTQRGGHITAYSEPGVGTTFRVYLPVTDSSPVPEERPLPEGGWSRGNETILLVEDEDSVRSAARDVLERQGYTVFAAADPHEAIALASQHGASIDLVVSDVVMPHSDGPTVIRRIREEHPRLKALLMSGYAGDALPKIDSIEGEFPFLAKPFTVMALARKIREVLDG
jgi:two-component system cell cycle sensor histidine kinase/response regulator CckA